MAAPHLHIQTIDKLRFLYEPHRYKVIYGGRGGLKSWSVAQALPILGMQRPLRVICGRETQSSIRESVHQLLENRIRTLGLLDYYEVLQYTIRARHPNANNERTEFIFTGLRDEDVRNIKSLEAADVLWVEEATNVTKYSWETIIPTVRKPGSEIWVTFNPELTTDDTYRRFVIHPPPTAKVVRTWFYENPWLPDEMRIEAEHLQKTDLPAYEHVWLGECRSQVEGAIFADELKRAMEESRIGSFPVDRTRPVHTFWDLGYGDDTAIWFAQIIGGWYHIVDYYENHGKTIEHYVIQLQNKGYLYGTDWLPHDAVDAIVHKKLAGDRSRSIEQLMRQAGRRVRVAAKLHVTDRINAARTIFSQLRFDEERCQDGLQPLHHYQWGPLNAKGESRREPLHNWACFHPETEVLTKYGKHQIMDLPLNKWEVLTPCGWQRYEGPRITKQNAQLVEVQLSDGASVRCTPEHLWLTESGWKSAESLQPGTLIQSCSTPSRNILMAAFIEFRRWIATISAAANIFIEKCGNGHLVPFPAGAISTITETIPQIIDSPIWNAYPRRNIYEYRFLAESQHSQMQPEQQLSLGINRKQEGYGISDTQNASNLGKSGSISSGLARIAARWRACWYALERIAKSIVPQNAASLFIIGVKRLPERADVCCIHVPDIQCFALANGAIVHNSHASDALCTLAVSIKPEKTPIHQPQPEPYQGTAWG